MSKISGIKLYDNRCKHSDWLCPNFQPIRIHDTLLPLLLPYYLYYSLSTSTTSLLPLLFPYYLFYSPTTSTTPLLPLLRPFYLYYAPTTCTTPLIPVLRPFYLYYAPSTSTTPALPLLCPYYSHTTFTTPLLLLYVLPYYLLYYKVEDISEKKVCVTSRLQERNK